MARPRLLDLFCGEGGASVGYHRAGFDVVGVDRIAFERYPFDLIEADIGGDWIGDLIGEFDAVHASPPCQAHSVTRNFRNSAVHPDLLPETRDLLVSSGKLYVIENVPGAPLLDPAVLCGSMFGGLRVRRHRLFETNWMLMAPPCGEHRPVTNASRDDIADPWSVWLTVVGALPNLDAHADAMGIDWMSEAGLAQAIPPHYTELIGRQLLDCLP